MVHVTHYPEEAVMADRVIVLDQGVIVAEGPPAPVLSDIERLHRISLRGPLGAELAALLRKEGFKLPPEIVTGQELVHWLCTSEPNS